jgi:hypothetical protein
MTHLRHVLMAALLLASLGAHAQAQNPPPPQAHAPQGQPQPSHAQQAHPPQPYPAPHGASGPYPRYDGRYSHNQYYPTHGSTVPVMPHQPVLITHPGGPYYYSSGVWYRPYGSSYVVVGAPLGVYVPILPVYYTTLWVSGVPYYYANDTYYTWNPAQNGYEVVAPPSDPGAVSPPPPSDDLFIYPQNGQSSEQQANDKYECHQWAVGQAGFDPTQAGGGAADPSDNARDNYQRAMRACLEGRGYSVR